MADSFDLHVFTAPWDEMQTALQRQSDKATMYALRATGRAVRAASRAAAPVYKGPDPRASAESGQLKKSIKSSRSIKKLGGGTYQMFVAPAGPRSTSKGKGKGAPKVAAVTRYGNNGARASTIANRQAKGNGSTTSGEVRGVPLYRRQMEEKYGYMKAGIDVGLANAQEVYEEAYKKAFIKYAP